MIQASRECALGIIFSLADTRIQAPIGLLQHEPNRIVESTLYLCRIEPI